MFGRSLLIVVIPLILLQAIATWVFYDRHWAAVSWRLSAGVAGDVGLIVETLKLVHLKGDTAILFARAKAQTDLDVTISHGIVLSPAPPGAGTLLEDQLNQAVRSRLNLPFRVELLEDGGA